MRTHCGHDELVNLLAIKFKRSLALLKEGSDYAEQTSGDAWDFALEIRHLRELGLSENDMRFLVRLQLVNHASELRINGTNDRKFRSTGALHFTNRTCFVLTSAGIVVATNLADDPVDLPVMTPTALRFPLAPVPSDAVQVPIWDLERHSLSFQGRVVKQFKWHAANQEMILSTFQEEGWPARIDDPLIPTPTLDIKRRLSDAIKCLNRNQQNKLIHFRGDGTGQAVVWEMAVPRYANGTAGKPQ